jgi:pimeloyl-ACP methyl ester carboxylesterase
MSRMDTRRVPVADGVELAADIWSPDRPAPQSLAFVLAHGLASNARLWDGVATRLVERGYTAITVDLRGHGRSSKPDGGYDVPTVADDVAALIARLGLDRPVVAGQSWGGNVVIELAARHSGIARGIVCVDGGWFEPSSTFPSWEACRAALAPPHLKGRRLAEIEGYIRGAHPDWPETGIAGTLANFEQFPDGTIAPWLTFERHITVLRGMFDHHPSERYPDVREPVLLLPALPARPDARSVTRDELVEQARTRLPRARVHAFTGDHDIHAQHPREVADVMIDAVLDGFFA